MFVHVHVDLYVLLHTKSMCRFMFDFVLHLSRSKTKDHSDICAQRRLRSGRIFPQYVELLLFAKYR